MSLPRKVALLQLASGLLNAWCLSGVAWSACGAVCGALTAPVGHLGGLWGWLALALIPLGWVEIFAGLYTLRTDALRWNRRLAVVEIASLPLGGLAAALVGVAVLRLMRVETGPVRPASSP